jgi:hypothetical protein
MGRFKVYGTNEIGAFSRSAGMSVKAFVFAIPSEHDALGERERRRIYAA